MSIPLSPDTGFEWQATRAVMMPTFLERSTESGSRSSQGAGSRHWAAWCGWYLRHQPAAPQIQPSTRQHATKSDQWRAVLLWQRIAETVSSITNTVTVLREGVVGKAVLGPVGLELHIKYR